MEVSVKLHKKRLQEKNVVINEVYESKDFRYLRSSDAEEAHSIYKASKVEKSYYYNNKKIYTDNDFDPEIKYTYVINNKDSKMSCSQCGHDGKVSDFYDGCPYCRSYFNIDYASKSKTGRFKFKDILPIEPLKRIYIILVGGGYLFAVSSLSFQGDFGIFAWLLALPMIPLFMIAMYIFMSILLFPYAMYKLFTHNDLPNDMIYMRKKKMDNFRIMNDLHYELVKYYYDESVSPENKDLIDFEIIDYIRYQLIYVGRENYIVIKYKVKKYFLIDGKIKVKNVVERATLKQNYNFVEDKDGIEYVECDNCGASIDLSKNYCEYCRTKVMSNNFWVLVKKS